MKFDTVVLGGGMVGVSVAVHLQKRALSVARAPHPIKRGRLPLTAQLINNLQHLPRRITGKQGLRDHPHGRCKQIQRLLDRIPQPSRAKSIRGHRLAQQVPVVEQHLPVPLNPHRLAVGHSYELRVSAKTPRHSR